MAEGQTSGWLRKTSMARPERRWRLPLLVFIIATILIGGVRLLLPMRGEPAASSDYVSFYEPVAKRILGGHGFTVQDGGLAARYPPGFSLVLAGLFATAGFLGLPAETLLSSFLSMSVGLAAALIFMISRTIFPARRAVLAAALFTSYPLVLWLARQPNSDVPFLAALYGAVLLFVVAVEQERSMAALACGIAIGLATLIRPIALALGVVMAALALLLRREVAPWRRAGLAALILSGNVLGILPWEWYLYQRTGHVIYVSTGGKKSVRDGLAFAGSRKSFRGPLGVPPGVADIARDVEAEWERTGLKTSGEIRSLMVAELGRRPLAVGELFALKAVRSWYATDSRRNEGAILGIQVIYLALLTYAGAKTWRAGGAGRHVVLMSTAVVAYFWLMTIAVLSIVRYMIPAIGLLFVLAPAVFPTTEAES